MGATKFHNSYNNLRTVEAADEAFDDRSILQSKLPSIFANHKNFGVCLVHRHCDLEDDEVMVADGNITQPEHIHPKSYPGLVDGQVTVALRNGSKRIAYPSSWLITGQPFEYTLDPTPPLPPQLLESFRETVLSDGVNIDSCVLGICHIAEPELGEDIMFSEHTEGRMNIVKKVELAKGMPSNNIMTCWKPKSARSHFVSDPSVEFMRLSSDPLLTLSPSFSRQVLTISAASVDEIVLFPTAGCTLVGVVHVSSLKIGVVSGEVGSVETSPGLNVTITTTTPPQNWTVTAFPP